MEIWGEGMIKEYVVELGLDVAKDKILEEKNNYVLRTRLEKYIEQQLKINDYSGREEELDFEGLVNYIREDLIEDVQRRIFGTCQERRIARETIIGKAVAYSQAKTTLSRQRAIRLTEAALDCIKDFYRKKANKDILLAAAQIEDTIITVFTEQMNANVESLKQEQEEKFEQVSNQISLEIQKNSVMSLEKNMQYMRDGKYGQVESSLSDWLTAMGCIHTLFPDYRFDIESVTHRFYSKPVTQSAVVKYPPKIRCTGTISMGGKPITRLNYGLIDYANRHQLPITLNVVTAKKFLGNELDPIQHEAEELVGESITIQPTPFPVAQPCSISLNEKVMFDFILFRTQEILDDGTVIISNIEQQNCPFKITMTANLQTQKSTYAIKTEDPNNEELLQYLYFIKRATDGGEISIKVLSLGEELARGNLGSVDYKSDFESIDEEISFLENVVLIEKYFKEKICIPEEIYQEDFNAISYLSSMIRGEECQGGWSKLELSLGFTDELKKKISEMDETPFCLSYVGDMEVPLYDKTYKLSAIKRFEAVKFQDLDRLKKKAEVLEQGDDIKIKFLPEDEGNGVWIDSIYTDKK